MIKQAAVRALADVGIAKGHPEFSNLFQYIYRGTAFALAHLFSLAPARLIWDPTNTLCTVVHSALHWFVSRNRSIEM